MILKLTFLEILLGAIPEELIFVFGVYVLSNKALDTGKILTTGIISGILVYMIRLLPIYMGINILIFFMVMTILLVTINKINIIKVIPALLILIITKLFTEVFSIFLATRIMHISPTVLASNHLLKLLYGTPGLLLFALIVFFIYRSRYQKQTVDE